MPSSAKHPLPHRPWGQEGEEAGDPHADEVEGRHGIDAPRYRRGWPPIMRGGTEISVRRVSRWTRLKPKRMPAFPETERRPAGASPAQPTGGASPGWLAVKSPQGLETAGLWRTELARNTDVLTRAQVAEWEAHNLRMMANIREGLGSHSGERALVVVGTVHKPYMDPYFDLISDVRVVGAGTVLGK